MPPVRHPLPRWFAFALAAAFPFALWAFATLFHGGNIGRWNDDYFFNTRDPATNAIAAWAITTRDPYLPSTGTLGTWRPLLFTLITGLNSLAWNHFWIVHVVGALLHAANALLLFRIMRRLGISLRAAAATCCLFICWAVHHEAWLWASALGSVTSALLLQCIILLMMRHARFSSGLPVPSPFGGGLGIIAAMMGVTLLILGFNEQASGALAALPLVWLAAASPRLPLRNRLMLAALPTVAVCILPPIYVWLVRATSQPGLGVNPESYVPFTKLWPRFLDVVREFVAAIALRDFWYPAFALGWRTWTVKNYIFLPWFLILLAAAVASLRMWVSGTGRNTSGNFPFSAGQPPGDFISSVAPRQGSRPRAISAAFGVAGALGTMLPIAIISGYPAHSRVIYVVLLLLMLPLACLFDAAGAAAQRHIFTRMPLRAAALHVGGWTLVLVLIFGGVMTVGTHERMRRIVAKDELNGMQLKEQLPNPLPGTLFLPVSVRPPVYTIEEIVLLHPWLTPARIPRELDKRRPEVGGFHWTVRSVWEGLWSMKYFVKFVYHRNDVWCLFAAEHLVPIEDITQEELRFVWNFGTPYAKATDPLLPDPFDAVVPTGLVVPITFDPQGNLLLVAALEVEREGVVLRTVTFPQVSRGVTARVRVGGGD